MAREHAHDHEHANTEKDPDEQVRLASDIGEELSEVFVSYVRGDVAFEELTFLTYEALGSIYAVRIGEYDLIEDDDEDEDGGYDIQEATDEQEDLAQEPAGG